MEIKLLLAKAISAMYYSSHSGKNDPEALLNVIDRTLDHLHLTDDASNSNREHNALSRVRNLVIWMKKKGSEHPYDINDLMGRIRIAAGDNDRLYDLFTRTILLVDDPDAAKDKLDEATAELYDFIGVEEFTKLLRDAARKLGFDREKVGDVARFREEIIAKMTELPLSGKRQAGGAMRRIDISDVESLSEVYAMAQLAIDPRAILKYGFKAANRMTGDQEGARRGEWANVSALPGMNKSGTLLDQLFAFCIFNSPVLFDDTKKPLHVFATAEDKPELVLQKLYTLLMQYEFGLPVVTKGVDSREIAQYVFDKMTANGWHVMILDYTRGADVDDYIDDLKQFIKEGYEIVSAGCDYINLLTKNNIVAAVAGDEIQGAHRRVRKFTSPNNIFAYTAHQLSPATRDLARTYPDDYIKRLVDKGYYEGSKKLNTEFDYEVFTAKTIHQGQAWAEFQWGKHRKIGATQEQDKYYALKFLDYPMMGFKYDLLLDEDLSYKKVGARTTNGEGGNDWRDFDD